MIHSRVKDSTSVYLNHTAQSILCTFPESVVLTWPQFHANDVLARLRWIAWVPWFLWNTPDTPARPRSIQVVLCVLYEQSKQNDTDTDWATSWRNWIARSCLRSARVNCGKVSSSWAPAYLTASARARHTRTCARVRAEGGVQGRW